MGQWLAENRPQVEYLCPALTPYPQPTRATLEGLVEAHVDENIWLMGSSLGGFWATWLAEKYDLKAVLINPVVDLALFNDSYLNVRLSNYHSGEVYTLNKTHVAGFETVDVPVIRRPENYLVMVQTGDEVLDYRLAVKKYTGSKLMVIQGGRHEFEQFQEYIPVAMNFLETGITVR